MILVDALQSVISILIMVTIGYVLTEIGWFNKKTSNLFSKIVVNISLPALMLHNLMTSFDKEYFLEVWSGIFIPLIGVTFVYLVSIPVSYLLKIKKKSRGLFRALFTFSNTIFIGLPVNIALFGEESTGIVTLYYVAHTTIFWTIGVYGIRKDINGKEEGIFSIKTLKRIISPILAAYIFSVILILLEISLPKFIMDTANYLGDLTTPLSMLFMGITIYAVDYSKIKFNRDMVAILSGRFIITPLIIYSLFFIFTGSNLMQKVFVIEAAMPIMATIAIVARAYNSDYEYATIMIAVTTLVSLIVIPVYMLLFTLL
ncbi:MAG: AEC family transporter [Bacillota bacterium]